MFSEKASIVMNSPTTNYIRNNSFEILKRTTFSKRNFSFIFENYLYSVNTNSTTKMSSWISKKSFSEKIIRICVVVTPFFPQLKTRLLKPLFPWKQMFFIYIPQKDQTHYRSRGRERRAITKRESTSALLQRDT